MAEPVLKLDLSDSGEQALIHSSPLGIHILPHHTVIAPPPCLGFRLHVSPSLKEPEARLKPTMPPLYLTHHHPPPPLWSLVRGLRLPGDTIKGKTSWSITESIPQLQEISLTCQMKALPGAPGHLQIIIKGKPRASETAETPSSAPQANLTLPSPHSSCPGF